MTTGRKVHFGMQTITATVSTTLVLLLVGMVAFFGLVARDLSDFVREGTNLSIELADNMRETDIFRFKAELEQQPFAKSVDYISKEQARHEYAQAMGVDPQEFLAYNPLPATFEVKLAAAYANTDSMAVIRSTLQADSRTAALEYQEDLIDAVNNNIRTISMILTALAVVLALISFALINNTIRLTVYSRRFLIYTMKLVGASHSFIRRPFMIRNFWIGVAATVMADALLWGAAYWMVNAEPQLATVVTAEMMLAVSGIVLAFGLSITILCAYMSINKYLGMKANRLYYI